MIKERKIRVLIVDDMPLMRKMLEDIVNSDSSLEVVGTANDGKNGVEKVKALNPDVVTMDLKMPIMDGIEALEKIMQETPVPILMVSGMDVKVVMKTLSLGAMDFIIVTQEVDKIAGELIAKIKIASRVKPLRRIKIRLSKPPVAIGNNSTSKIVAIGASTGGPQALQVFLSRLPSGFPASILIVQHITKGFINGLAEWLNSNSSLDVRIAKEGDSLEKPAVYLAPDNCHMEVGKGQVINLSQNEFKNMRHVPSIDVMMKSVSGVYEENVIGVLMTGMGEDGVEGMRCIKEAGGMTIAQDEETSTIFGMNKVAIEKGYVDEVSALDHLADKIIHKLF